MNASSDNSSHHFLEWVCELLWHQWSTLGVSGEAHPEDAYLIDPEALLLFSTSFARYDARLFDEMLDWLILNGKLINLQRLRNLQESTPGLGNTYVLAAIADLLGGKAILRKWKVLQELVQKYARESDPQSLFLNTNQSSLPVFGKIDERFQKYGLLRAPYRPSGKSMRPHVNQQACLLMKLRSLFGINARAEVVTYLLTHASGHPAEIARETGYFKKTIQDCLNEMELSGHIRSFDKGREKHFRVDEVEWKFLRTWNESEAFPKWMNWATFFNFLTQLWKLETNPKWSNADLRLLSVERKKLFAEYQSFFSAAGLSELNSALMNTGSGNFPRLVIETIGNDFHQNQKRE